MSDALGDRMKLYEDLECNRRFMPLLPIMARLDGRAFHSFCKGLERPFDKRLKDLMVAVTHFLVRKTGALIGYRQSDEISLVFYSPDTKSQVFFDGRITKMTSMLAAMASVEFNRLLLEYLPEKADLTPTFDCRVWQVPTLEEAANCFLWRERDATRNSILSAGQAEFSHKEMQGLSTSVIQDRLHELRGVNWNDYPAWAKRGTWVRRVHVQRPFTTSEIDKLPAKHEAQSNPGLIVERAEVRVLDMPSFGSVVNRADVIFHEADPVLNTEETE